MHLDGIHRRIIELLSRLTAEVGMANAISRTDINRVAETVLVPLFAEVCGFHDLEDLNLTESENAPAVDLGDKVARGQPLAVLEAMKMEHTIAAPHGGVVEALLYAVGDQVAEGGELLRLSSSAQS